jgi:predicted lipoprotein with Yx(FWY)xxD motif
MKRFLIIGIVVAAAAAAGIALAATNGGSRAAKSGRATVSIMQISGAGKVLVDSSGHALYRNNQEHGAVVLCKAGCVSIWKPLVVHGRPTGKSLPGKLGTAMRPGGVRQVTYNGKRLYTFTPEKARMVTGDGAKDAFGGHNFSWDVVHPAGKSSSTTTPTSTTPYPYSY